MASVGKSIAYFIPADAQAGNGIATDVGEVIGPRIVVTALQQQAVGKLIPDFEVNTHRAEGVGQYLLVGGMEFILFAHGVKLKKACRDDKPLLYAIVSRID